MAPAGFDDFFFYSSGDHRDLHSFPTRRSSDLIIVGSRGHGSIASMILGSVSSEIARSEEHTSELQSRRDLVCRLLLEKKKTLCRRRPLPSFRLRHTWPVLNGC